MKKIAAIIICSFFIIKTLQAQVLNGKYRQEYLRGYVSSEFNFENNKFTDTAADEHLFEYTVGKGTYEIKKNKFILNYEHIDPDTSSYVFTKKNSPNKNIGHISIKVYDAKDSLRAFAFCGLKNNKNKYILYFFSDKIGKTDLTICNSQKFKTLCIFDLVSYPVCIPVSQIMGTNMELTVFFKRTTTSYTKKHREIYTIEKITPEQIILIRKDKSKMILNRLE